MSGKCAVRSSEAGRRRALGWVLQGRERAVPDLETRGVCGPTWGAHGLGWEVPQLERLLSMQESDKEVEEMSANGPTEAKLLLRRRGPDAALIRRARAHDTAVAPR